MSSSAPAQGAPHDYYDDDEDVEVEYVEEIEYVDDTDEEGSYIVEEYVDEDEEEGEEGDVQDDEGQGQPPIEISCDNHHANISSHEMSQGSLLHRDDDDEPEEESEDFVDEASPHEAHKNQLEAEEHEEAVAEATVEEVPTKVELEEIPKEPTTHRFDDPLPATQEQQATAGPAEEEPSKAEDEAQEGHHTAETPVEDVAVAEAAPTSNPRSLFQRRKSFGSSAKSVGSQKSNATSGSAVSKSGGSTSKQPRPGLLRSGSSKSIRSIGKGIKNVFRRKSGKGNSKDEPTKDEPNELATAEDSVAIVDEPSAGCEAEEPPSALVVEANNTEREIDQDTNGIDSPSSTDQEIPTVLSSSINAVQSFQPPASPEPMQSKAVAVASPASVPSPARSVVRIKRDSAPVSPSRSSKPAVTTTETTTTTTTTTYVTTTRVEASGKGAITSTTTSATSTTSNNPNEDVQYSYSKDGKTYYTDKLEKQEKLAWKKPEWTSSSPLRKTNKGVVLKERGTLEKPIVIPADKSVEKETGIGWSKPSWTKEKVLKSTEKGSALKSGVEIARPITLHTNQV